MAIIILGGEFDIATAPGLSRKLESLAETAGRHACGATATFAQREHAAGSLFTVSPAGAIHAAERSRSAARGQQWLMHGFRPSSSGSPPGRDGAGGRWLAARRVVTSSMRLEASAQSSGSASRYSSQVSTMAKVEGRPGGTERHRLLSLITGSSARTFPGGEPWRAGRDLAPGSAALGAGHGLAGRGIGREPVGGMMR
jgi:hypothetical protein